LRIPLFERVAGSEVFERLRAAQGDPIRVFFFGGPDGVAERACERLNAEAQGLRCVGFDAPGFGTIEEMSGEDRISRINASGAQFVIVSLGARKGQAWIERNRGRLRAPLISHLGAVVNFVAGTVARAPRWMQRIGLEWLWRIKEEPHLWRRYAADAVALARLLLTHALPYAVYVRRSQPTAAQLATASLAARRTAQGAHIELHGAWSSANSSPLRAALAAAVTQDSEIHVDLGAVTYVDAGVLALLSLLRAHCKRAGRDFRLAPVPPAVRRVFDLCGASYVLEALPESPRESCSSRPC
jgi:N-acetylglucosaminyldiphosphoundecaprenol N-acetyl-beta-D-mannosaminyltransferase